MKSLKTNAKYYKWLVLSCTTIGALMSVLSGGTLMIALPVLMRDLHSGMNIAVWILMGYMLSMTVLVPSIGRIADMVGRKKLYISGFVIFTASSLLCSLSQNGVQLLVFRLVQSVGGSLMVANSTAIVADVFPPTELGSAMGINSMVISVASVLGPILGGFLVTIGWRSIFWINVPIGIIGTIWAAIQIKEKKRKDTDAGGQPVPKETFDFFGTLFFTVGLLALLGALSLGGFGSWLSPAVIAMFAAAAVFLGAFIAVETHIQSPMLDLTLFKSRDLTFAYLSNLLNGIARGAIMFLLIFFLQGIKSIDPVTAGVLLAPMAIPMIIFAPISGHFSDKFGARFFTTSGLLISALGLLLLAFIKPDTSIFLICAFMFIAGIGSGLFISPNSSSILNSVPSNRRGVASGMRTMCQNAGSVLSIAISMAVVASSISPEAMQALFIGTQVGSQGIHVSSFITGLSQAFIMSCVFSVIAAVMAFMNKDEARLRRIARG